MKTHLLHFINQQTLMIGLEQIQLQFRKLIFQLIKEFFKRSVAIDLWFSFSQEIEIRAMDDMDMAYQE